MIDPSFLLCCSIPLSFYAALSLLVCSRHLVGSALSLGSLIGSIHLSFVALLLFFWISILLSLDGASVSIP